MSGRTITSFMTNLFNQDIYDLLALLPPCPRCILGSAFATIPHSAELISLVPMHSALTLLASRVQGTSR